MKVILSRKGFDSGYGGYPSIILPNKEMITLPIPSNKEEDYSYGELKTKDNQSIYEIMKSLNKNIKGYGMFTYNEELDLSKKGMTRTCWELPEFFKGVNMTYHNKESWKERYFKSACRGQEFVIEENKEVEKWAIHLIECYSTNHVKETIKN